jgi:hypothetical protein
MSLYPWYRGPDAVQPPSPPSDPSREHNPAPLPEPGPYAYLGGAAEMASSEQPVVAETETFLVELPVTEIVAVADTAPVAVEAAAAVEAPVYPIGEVDFNKPFEIQDSHNDENVHTDARIILVLSSGDYPIVIHSINEDSDEVVNQFDADGRHQDRGLEIVNVIPDVFPRTIYILIDKQGRELIVDDVAYDSQTDAMKDVSFGDTVAVFPITLLEDTFKPFQPAPAPVTIDNATGQIIGDTDDDAETESEAEVEEEGDDAVEELPEGALYVNGVVRKPGDKVRTTRTGRGTRICTVIKTRSDPFKSLYVQADNGSEEPYWARNKSVHAY